MKDIFYYITSTLENVVFVTPREVINWMKNPIPFSEMKTSSNYSCKIAFNSSKTCSVTDCSNLRNRLELCGIFFFILKF